MHILNTSKNIKEWRMQKTRIIMYVLLKPDTCRAGGFVLTKIAKI